MSSAALKTVPGLVQIQIVNFRRWDLTVNCIQSVRKLRGNDWRLLVIDNGSSNESVAKLRELYPDVAVLETGKNIGWGGAQNLGRHYEGFGDFAEFILAVNSDAELDTDCLMELKKTMSADADCAVVAPLIYKDKTKSKIDNVGYNLSYRYFLPMDPARWTRNHSRHFQEGSRQVTWTDDTVALLRASMVEEAGGYDEGYFLYVDMTDLAYRLRRRGCTLWVSYRALAYHSGKGSSGDGYSVFSLYHKFRGWWRFQNKYFSKWHRPYVMAWITCIWFGIGLKLWISGRGGIHWDFTKLWLRERRLLNPDDA